LTQPVPVLVSPRWTPLWKTLLAKKVFIKSYGCQMNVYDAARMADVLAPEGYVGVDAAEDADLVILNTCHIREKAAEKIYSELGRLRGMRDARKKAGAAPVTIAVAGCVAQAEGDEIIRRAPHVDLVLGPQTYHRLPAMLRGLETGGARVDTDFPVEAKFDHLPPAAPQGPAAFLTVQEGCDKFCAFCVVPYTRGAEFSRPLDAVMAEARRLVADGAREITLLGQNVNAWHGAEGGLAALLDALARIDGLDRLRYTTSHPRDMDDALIRAHGDNEKLMPYLHLPVQSGSDAVLARMNRGHTADGYLGIIDRLRAARPDIALSSDFIVGHPGETEADFAATLSLVRRVGFAQAYSFKYSPRPGTPAADMDDQIAEPVKAERLARLQDALNEGQLAFNQGFVGRDVAVLLDRRGRHADQLAGRSPHMQAVHVACDDPVRAAALFGRIALVRVVAAHGNSLAARLADTAAEADDAGPAARARA
jgi:tRNA-2-methylthio-N6-dimethylallyladenosine synthase